MRIDLHTHSAVSDGTDTPAELVSKAAAAQLDVVALTDHDTFDGIAEAQEAGRVHGVRVLPGIEISTQWQGRSVHLLGLGLRSDDAALGTQLQVVRDDRATRIPRTLQRLQGLGLALDLDEVLVQARGTSIGRPHVADAMVARGYVQNRDEAFDRYLYDGGPAFVDRYAIPLEDAIALVQGAGGVTVLAHPWSRGGAEVMTPDVLARLAADHGLDAVEADHPDHDAGAREGLRQIGEALGLLVTGSSDYHGTGKTRNPLGADLTEPEVWVRLTGRIAERGGISW